MDDDHVFGKLNSLPVQFVVHQENVAGLLRQRIFAALQGIVESLGHLKKIIASSDDVPLCSYFKFIQQWHQLVEHFSDASTHSRGVDHLHRLTL